MFTIILLITALSLDAFSFGLAQGFKKNKLSFINCIIMTILSTFLFTLPLCLSKFIYKYFNENLCNIINGIILTILGLYYIFKYITNKKRKNTNENVENITLNLKICILSTFPISLDAIFTAFLNGYTIPKIILAVIIYFCFTFCSLYLTNKIALKFSKKCNIDLSWLSGVIFIIIGLLKTFGI